MEPIDANEGTCYQAVHAVHAGWLGDCIEYDWEGMAEIYRHLGLQPDRVAGGNKYSMPLILARICERLAALDTRLATLDALLTNSGG